MIGIAALAVDDVVDQSVRCSSCHPPDSAINLSGFLVGQRCGGSRAAADTNRDNFPGIRHAFATGDVHTHAVMSAWDMNKMQISMAALAWAIAMTQRRGGRACANAPPPQRRRNGAQRPPRTPDPTADERRRRGSRRHRPAPVRIDGERHQARATTRPGGHPLLWRQLGRRAADRTGAADQCRGRAAGRAAQRQAHFGLPGNPRHSVRGDPAGRDPARGCVAELRLCGEPEGREYRPAPAFPTRGPARSRRARPPAAGARTARPAPTCSRSSASGG